ncbi:Protein flp [Pseudocercospora fuligena]|uniref:Protein flp n=1 Tax=Pseudocercospora fuligena TaxID=685502 RepID=A0A8H6REJ2_9PEZI|nr:Protein flp [Pseudocercospora fuligena]
MPEPEPESPFTESFDTLVTQTLQRHHCPGTSISVIHNDRTYSKAYGYSDLKSQTPIQSSQTLFYGCSTTKAMLCAAWGIYINSPSNQKKPESERISFSTPLSKIIPEDFVLPDTIRTAETSLEDVLSHRSGMCRHELSYGFESVKDPRSITRNLRNLPLHNENRKIFEYCNTGYVAASYALDVVAGKQFMRRAIWEPLGMRDTFGGLKEAEQEGRGEDVVKLYSWSDEQWREEPSMDLTEVAGAGYVISTAEDYAKWMRCLLERGPPLSEEIIEELFKPRIPATSGGADSVPLDGGFANYALGWFVGAYRGRRVYYHAGGIIGGGSRVMLCPEIGWGATFLSNGNSSGELLKGLLFELLDTALREERTGYAKCEEVVPKMFEEIRGQSEKSFQKVFPNLPERPVVPLALPLVEYAGTFRSVGYGNLDIKTGLDPTSGEETLLCDIEDRTWRAKWTFRRINGEHWRVDSDPSQLPQSRRAESRVEYDGRISWGIAMEPAMLETLIWFH